MTADANAELLALIGELRAFLSLFDRRELERFLADWPQRPRIDRAWRPSALPVLARLGELANGTAPATEKPTKALLALAPDLTWRQSYTADDFGAAFLQRYGFTELIGLRGPVASRRIACGFVLLGPGTVYPDHRHEAEEIYVTMAGTAAWRKGRAPWADVAPGNVIHHTSRMPHAMRTAAEPVLAFYIWRGGDLAQKSLMD